MLTLRGGTRNAALCACPCDGLSLIHIYQQILLPQAQALAADMAAFSRGDYVRALEQNTMAETISKVLYPADDHISGKRLRLRQQYLLVSASLQSIVKAHLDRYRTLKSLPEKVAIHINDTHPALCVPELMRLLIDEYDMGWDEAWDICCRTLSYTNHTVMSEALERWSVELFREQLPRIFSICLLYTSTGRCRTLYAHSTTCIWTRPRCGRMTATGAASSGSRRTTATTASSPSAASAARGRSCW